MREETVARSYAATLVEVAERSEGLDVYGEALSMVAGLFQESPEFRTFLTTPRIDAGAKKRALRSAFGEHVPRRFLNFLLVTIDKRRQSLLPLVAREFAALVDERMGRAHAEVTVARPLGEEGRRRVEEALGRVLGAEVVAHERLKPEILGGLVVRSGDRVWDGSLRRRLEDMRRSLLAAAMPAAPPAPGESGGERRG